MAEKRVQRRLAAILAADVVGYTRLMQQDEAGTLAQLKTLRREVFDPKTTQYGGHIFKNTGDGALTEFQSGVGAVECAVEIQRVLALRNAEVPEDRRIILRLGIGLGDVIVDGEDLYGNAVNVAARMEGLAEPGSICVSGNVRDHVGNSIDVNFEDLGEQTVKNIDQPIRVYRIVVGAQKSDSSPGSEIDALLRRPAVAVLPFENLSGDPDQEYFADGLTEDIITALSMWRLFPVIARNSTFSFKGRAVKVQEVAEELGARYVVEGSVRKAGDRIRVTAQLINAETGHHVWAERYDRELADIFDLQDDLTKEIAAIIEPELERAEQRRLATIARPENLEAWELLQRAISLIHAFNADDNARAQEFLNQAIEIDPNFSQAYGWLSFSLMRDHWLGFTEDRERALAEHLDAGRKAVELDPSDPQAHRFYSLALHWNGRLGAALEEAETAIRLNPNNADAYATLGFLLGTMGRTDEAVHNSTLAQQLNPLDARNPVRKIHITMSYLIAGDFNSAAESAEKAIQQNAELAEAHFLRAVALGHLDRPVEALDALAECEALRPGFIDQFHASRPYLKQTVIDGFFDGLRKAGWEG